MLDITITEAGYFRKKEAYAPAIDDYGKAIKLDPKLGMAFNDRAWAYFRMGRAFEGLPDAQIAVELEPDNPLSLDTRAHIHEALGNKAAAVSDYRRALALKPSQVESLEGLRRLQSR